MAMLLVDQVFHVWMRAGSFQCTPISYVDNWELILNQPENVRHALDRALEFAAQWDLTIDRTKTYAWSVTSDARARLRADGLVVKHDDRDLGAHLTFTRQIRNRTVTQRIQDLQDFWEKLRLARGSTAHKIRAVKTAAWPRALHGVSAVIVGRKHWEALRTCYMNALRFAKPGANPMVQMLLDGFGSDPQLYAIWTSLLDFRALGTSDLQLSSLDLVASLDPSSAQASISAVLCHRVHQLGWRLLSQGVVHDRLGSFRVTDCSLGELRLRVEWAWHDVVASSVAHRLDFGGFERVDVGSTVRGLRCLPLVDQAAMRALLNGTTFTNRHAYHWSSDGTLLCPACAGVDGLYHKYWGCPFVADLLQNVPPEVVEVVHKLPEWARDRGWTVSAANVVEWRRYLLGLPHALDFQQAQLVTAGTLDLFTDGSCLFGSDPSFRLAAWSVCVALPSASLSQTRFQVVSAAPLRGLVQTAYRAELFALYAALCFADHTGSDCRIWTDCLGVYNRFKLLTMGRKALVTNSPHADLWALILEVVNRLGTDRVVVAKVTAHVSPADLDDDVEKWLARGNQSADGAAKQANVDRSPAVWSLWHELVQETARLRRVGNDIRNHMVAVNRRWLAYSTSLNVPVVHRTRVANLPPMKWVHPATLPVVKGLFRRYFGVEFAMKVSKWWLSLVHPSAEPSWISFAQLYVDWQLNTGSAGVTKFGRKWHVYGVAGDVPEQKAFRVRCKHFRLMLQQFAKDAGISFATCTGRPQSDWLQCHIGCASVAADSQRIQAVETWLKRKVPKPIFGHGISLDQIPPAW